MCPTETPGVSLLWDSHMNCDRLGTLMLMSPMLMLRGISGRLMFFTAETARDGAAERPPCQREEPVATGPGAQGLAMSPHTPVSPC